jgi:putative transposase
VKPTIVTLALGAHADVSGSKADLLVENALLRQQVIVLRRQVKRPRLTQKDRIRLVLLARRTRFWARALHIIQPDTLLRRHRSLFRLFWPYTSRNLRKKQRIFSETIGVLHRMVRGNHLWGAERIRGELLKLGITLSKRTIQKYILRFESSLPRTTIGPLSSGIYGRLPGPRLSRPAPENKIFPYLLRNLAIVRPNQVWGIDIIRRVHGRPYLVAVPDWFSRLVMSWALDQTLEMGFVMEAVEMALTQGKPDFWNGDQGGHFTSEIYSQQLQEADIQITMDGKERATDNIFVERLWRTVKYEEVYPRAYETPQEARRGLGRYFLWYNHRRGHQSLGYRTPAAVHYGTC